MQEALNPHSPELQADVDLVKEKPGVASLVGELGELTAKRLIEAELGDPVDRVYGNGIDRAPNGTLRVTVDPESFDALFAR